MVSREIRESECFDAGTHPDPRSGTRKEMQTVLHLVAQGRDEPPPVEELDAGFEGDGVHGLSLMGGRMEGDSGYGRRETVRGLDQPAETS